MAAPGCVGASVGLKPQRVSVRMVRALRPGDDAVVFHHVFLDEFGNYERGFATRLSIQNHVHALLGELLHERLGI